MFVCLIYDIPNIMLDQRWVRPNPQGGKLKFENPEKSETNRPERKCELQRNLFGIYLKILHDLWKYTLYNACTEGAFQATGIRSFLSKLYVFHRFPLRNSHGTNSTHLDPLLQIEWKKEKCTHFKDWENGSFVFD